MSKAPRALREYDILGGKFQKFVTKMLVKEAQC